MVVIMKNFSTIVLNDHDKISINYNMLFIGCSLHTYAEKLDNKAILLSSRSKHVYLMRITLYVSNIFIWCDMVWENCHRRLSPHEHPGGKYGTIF